MIILVICFLPFPCTNLFFFFKTLYLIIGVHHRTFEAGQKGWSNYKRKNLLRRHFENISTSNTKTDLCKNKKKNLSKTIHFSFLKFSAVSISRLSVLSENVITQPYNSCIDSNIISIPIKFFVLFAFSRIKVCLEYTSTWLSYLDCSGLRHHKNYQTCRIFWTWNIFFLLKWNGWKDWKTRTWKK